MGLGDVGDLGGLKVNFMYQHFRSIFLKLIISFGLLILLVYNTDIVQLLDVAKNIKINYFLVMILFFFPNQLFNAYRWYYIIRILGGNARYISTVRFIFLGHLTSLFLPGQISGDIIRGTAIIREEQQFAQGFFSLVLDRLSSLFGISLLAWIGIQSSSVLSSFPELLVAVISLSLFVFIVMMFLVLYRNHYFNQWILQKSNVLPNIFKKFFQLIIGVLELPKVNIIIFVWIIICAIVMQIMNILGSFFLAQAMSITISPLDWMAVNSVVTIIQILPISIGGLGIRESAFVVFLSFYAISSAQALAFSLVSFVMLGILVGIGLVIIDLFQFFIRKSSYGNID